MRKDFTLAFCPVIQGTEATHLLTDQEIALIGKNATQKRVGDFIAGRMAAKSAIRSYLSLEDRVVPSILRMEEGEEAGKPYVLFDKGAASLLPPGTILHVSITHADQKAYAVVSRTRIGIDNVTIEPYSKSFIAEVFQKVEHQAWADWLGVEQYHPLAVCSGFAAKEAFLKWMGVGLRYELPMVQIIPARQEQAVQQTSFFQHQFQALCRISKDSVGQTHDLILDGYYSIESGQVIIMLMGE